MAQYQENATVIRIEQFSPTNFRLTLYCPSIAAGARPGQFVMIKTGSGKDPLLRRPFSLHQTSVDGMIQIYFKVVGRGTDILAQMRENETLSVFGPLGRGFRLNKITRTVIVGGGLGIAPLLFLAKENCRLKQDCGDDLIVLGARTKNEIEPLLDDFRQFGISILIATDDGSLGHHGVVVQILEALQIPAECTVYGCGPEPMLAGLSQLCAAREIPCQVSVESVMACGMGACLGCNREAAGGGYTHVCLNGPVYDAEDLLWNI